MNILQVRHCYHLIKTIDVLKSPNVSSIKDELKQMEDIFPQNLINNLICAKLKEIVNLQYIKTDKMKS